MATYAVGDIQGCYAEFLTLLELIHFRPGQDQLWLTGDLVNRGPDSLAVLRHARDLGEHCQIVLGNHDLHLLAVAYGQHKSKGKDTLDAILAAPDRDELLAWLRQQPLIHHDPALGFTMVHAGIPPQWSLDDAQSYANEVHQTLRSDRFMHYLGAMYGNTPAQWSPDLQDLTRLRVITNYFTRMRFCDPQGLLDLNNKESAEAAPTGMSPWFAHPHRRSARDPIVFGHWATLMGRADSDNVHALDTGCIWGGSLTAMRLDDGARFAVPSTRRRIFD